MKGHAIVARRSIQKTLESLPRDAYGALGGASPAIRREEEARKIARKYGSALEKLAKLAFEATDPRLQLDALKALAPYLYPAMRAVEVSGPGGERLVVEVRKISPSVSPGPSDASSDASGNACNTADPGSPAPSLPGKGPTNP